MQKPLDFLIASLIGAVLLVIVGYFVQADGVSFTFWLGWFPKAVAMWAILGVLIGSGLRYLAR